ncbi:Aspartokinase, partial [hydrothermal vent metagenome]
NSALSFSVCIEDKFNNFKQLLIELESKYNVHYVENVSLYTIRHASKEAVSKIEQKGKVLLKQATKGTVQVVIQ